MSANAWEVLFAGLTAAFTGAIAVTGVWALLYAKRQLSEDRESQKVRT